MREGKEKDGEGRLFQRMLFMPKVTHRTGGTRRTKKQSVHYRILRSYKDTLHGRSVIIGFQKTQIYQRFAGSRQEVFILIHRQPHFDKCVRCKLAVEFYSKMGYTMFERS